MTKDESQILHDRNKKMSAPLSADLKEDYGFNSLPIRKGDRVRVMTGDFKGVEGEVTDLDTKTQRVTIEGVETAKADETEVSTPVHASNVELVTLEGDEMRDKIIERRSESG